MKNLTQVINDLFEKEGGYVNHPNDLGGPTVYGITERVAREWGYEGPIKDLSKMTAKMIYIKRYWIESKISTVNKVSPEIAIKLFDIAVNMGVHRASVYFQRILNLLADTPRLILDGDIGRKTIRALENFMLKRRHQEGEKVFVKALQSLQGHHYINTSEVRSQNKSFIFGWLRNRV